MRSIICSLECSWDAQGKVNSTILVGAAKDEPTNVRKVLAPSLPMLTCHQLGVFTPMTGLCLTKQFIDYVLLKQSAQAPIDSVLQSATIEVVVERGNAVMLFRPRTSFLANSERVERASRQFLYNYSMHVLEKQPYYSLVGIKICLGMALREYLDLLARQISSGQLGLARLAWNSDIGLFMAATAINMNKGFGLATAETYNPEAEKNVLVLFHEVEQKHNNVCKELGV